MNRDNEYKDLTDCLNQIEIALLNIDNSSIPYNQTDKTLSISFLERLLENIKLIYKIRQKSYEYSLEQWQEIKKGTDYHVPYYVIADTKGAERFRLIENFYYHEYLWITEIYESYNCRRLAAINDLICKNITKNNLFIKESEGVFKGLIYEDESEAFLITTRLIFEKNNVHKTTNISYTVSISFLSDDVIEIYYLYDKRHGYLKGTEYTAKMNVKIPEWNIISDTITHKEDYSLK